MSSLIIDVETVRKMAQLSCLAPTPSEVAQYAHELSAILDYASGLPTEAGQVAEVASLRLDPDVVRHFTGDVLRNAVAIENGAVKVPVILDKTESI